MEKIYPNVLVFACGEPEWGEGGSGFEAMVKAMRANPPILEVTIHSVPPFSRSGYDTGLIIARIPVEILTDDTPVVLQDRVKTVEHYWQSRVLNHVVHGRVRFVDGQVIYETKELKRRLMPAAE